MDEIGLSADDTRALVQAGKDITQLRTIITKAQAAGLDVEGLKAKLEKAEQLRNGLLHHFGPQTT